MDFTFRRQVGDLTEEVKLEGVSREMIEQLLGRWTGSEAGGFDTEGMQAQLYADSFDDLAAAYAEVGLHAEERYEAAIEKLEQHRPIPKSTGRPPNNPWFEPRRSMSFVMHEPRKRQFKKQGGELGAVNYATLIECQLCGYTGEGWAQGTHVEVKCHECRTKLRVEKINPHHDGANEAGQMFRAIYPADYLYGREMI